MTARSSVYEVDGHCFESASSSFAEVVAAAHAARQRPRCLCQRRDDGRGVEMYVARLGDGYIVKRMPETGRWHAPDCPSYEASAEPSGSEPALEGAITRDPVTGDTMLRLDVPLSKVCGPSSVPSLSRASSRPGAEASESASVGEGSLQLSLGGLLHYLWERAQLTHWRPGFAGKRSWATVRWHLLNAAGSMVLGGHPLVSRLYIPEVFSIERRAAIDARRKAQWSPGVTTGGGKHPLMLLIGELKRIAPARHGFEAVVKHVPDQAFAIDERLYNRVGRRFASEFAWWGSSEDMHMIIIAAFSVTTAGVPTLAELSLMLVTRHWLPVKDRVEKDRVERLVRTGKAFVTRASDKAPAQC